MSVLCYCQRLVVGGHGWRLMNPSYLVGVLYCVLLSNAIGFDWVDYLELVVWSGRVIREDKRGALAGNLPPVLQRLGLNADGFAEHVQGHADRPHPRVLGRLERIRDLARAVGQGFLQENL